jgi:predicted methyltransferase
MRLLPPIALALIAAAPIATSFAAPPKPAKPAAATRPGIRVDPAIRAAVADPGRPEAERARDRYRHPAQTLSFFGVKPDMTVVEMLPGGGWYSAILAPMLAAQGRYVAAVPPGKATDGFRARMGTDPARYAKVEVAPFVAGQPNTLAPDGTADMVLTFRNIHNLLGSADQAGDGNAPQAFADWFRALKPGGVLGIVEHRLPESMDTAREKTSGYVKRSTVLRLAMAAGFQFAGATEVNANPRDTHDWPEGVWTLPPSYALKDKDREKYAAIGESDRMTLKFVKPGGAADPAPAQ